MAFWIFLFFSFTTKCMQNIVVVVTPECPICIEHIAEAESTLCLDMCTQDIPQARQHIFHRSCLEAAYKSKPKCPICRRPINSAELIPLEKEQTLIQKSWYISKKIACGFSYGLLIHSLLYTSHLVPFSLAGLSITSQEETMHNPLVDPEEEMDKHIALFSVFIGVLHAQSIDMLCSSSLSKAIISLGSVFILIHNLKNIPPKKRRAVLSSIMLGICVGIKAGHELQKFL